MSVLFVFMCMCKGSFYCKTTTLTSVTSDAVLGNDKVEQVLLLLLQSPLLTCVNHTYLLINILINAQKNVSVQLAVYMLSVRYMYVLCICTHMYYTKHNSVHKPIS